MQLLRSLPINNMTMHHNIAAAAQIGKGMLFHYFRNAIMASVGIFYRYTN